MRNGTIPLPYACLANSYIPPALGNILVSSPKHAPTYTVMIPKNNQTSKEAFPALFAARAVPKNIPVPIMAVIVIENTLQNPRLFFNSTITQEICIMSIYNFIDMPSGLVLFPE
jgi:hypothetical protein